MKAVILLLIIFLLLGCGSRTKTLVKAEETTRLDSNADYAETKSAEADISSVTDIRNFLLTNGLKIKSTGQNYKLRYGDWAFSGSADVELLEKKEETVLHHRYINHIKYQTHTTYKTQTFYKTAINSKNLNVNRAGLSFGNLVCIIVASLVSGVVFWESGKRLIKRQ